MADPDKKPVAPGDVLRTEAEAERELDRMISESKDNIASRCPECGALGSLEEIAGALRCIDCDLTVAAATKISGFGRR